ncbi:sodium-dependent multivitamin transporter-like isoform X2 [Octopus sinensis]|nr:sodium-dependent multivitamin transporter-like isoform X2 [Octopus sinensis]
MVPTFSISDYLVFIFIVFVSIAIGLFFGCRQKNDKTANDFMTGNRQLSALPLALSLMVSFQSSIMVLGMPAEAYVYGIMYFFSVVGFMICLLISSHVYAEFFHKMNFYSINEYIKHRYKSEVLKVFGVILSIAIYVWYMGIMLYGPAVALQAVAGFNMWYSISILAVSAILYTAIGGLRAVIWTDVFQSFVMYFCLLVAIIKGINEVGNLNDVWEISRETQRLDLDFRFDPFTRHTVFNLMFGYVLYAFGTVFNQSSFQRITVAKTPRTAAWVLMLAGPFYALTTGLAIFQGLLAFAYFKTKRCDPLEAGIISNPNQIMPYYMLMLFQNWRGMPGLFVAALFSACLSTMSSGLSSLSTITWIDIFQPMLKSPSDAKATFVCKAAVVIYGLMSLGVAVLVSNIGGTLTQIGDTLVSSFSGPLTGMILFGTLCPWANKKGALAGTLCAIVITLWVAFGSIFSSTLPPTPYLPPAPTDQCPITNISIHFTSHNFTTAEMVTNTTKYSIRGIQKLYSLSYTMNVPIAILIVFVVGTIVSLIFYKPHEVNQKYVVPVCEKVCCCLPSSARKKFRSRAISTIKDEENMELDSKLERT